MKHRVIITIGSGIVFVCTGWFLRGQGTFYNDKTEYLWGQALIALGLIILGLEIWQLVNKRRQDGNDI